MTDRDCPSCGHSRDSHNSGVCTLTGVMDATGYHDFPGGCGCTALGTNAVCQTGGEPYYCWLKGTEGHPDQHDCYSHWRQGMDDDTEQRFAPLRYALEQRGIHPDPVWNTGGNIMCMAVQLNEGGQYPYIMFSDEAEWIGFGLYLGDNAESVGFDPDWVAEYPDPWDTGGWATPGLAERTGDWVAAILPAIRVWLADAVTVEESEPRLFFGSMVTDVTATWAAAPVIAGTNVTDFSSH